MMTALRAAGLFLAITLPFVPTGNYDGDTLRGLAEVRPGLYELVTVRLDCLNAPELRADGGGHAEQRRLAAWLAQDGGYALRTEWHREKYGRLLGEPLRGDAGFCAGVR